MTDKLFDFNNANGNLVPVLKQMLEFIGTNLPAHAGIEKTVFNSRVILTELLTNSLKHSGSKSSLVHITINRLNVIITKTDHGKPLSLLGHNQLIPCKIPITNDILHTLYATAESNQQLCFTCEENNMEDILAIDDIVEHFGLLIITKAADNFTYNYDCIAKSNIFNVILSC
jgi:hypothetical protein